MRFVQTRGSLDGLFQVAIQGIVRPNGDVESVRLIDGVTGEPATWAMNDRQIEQLRKIVGALVRE